jgi:hypothetical protein
MRGWHKRFWMSLRTYPAGRGGFPRRPAGRFRGLRGGGTCPREPPDASVGHSGAARRGLPCGRKTFWLAVAALGPGKV